MWKCASRRIRSVFNKNQCSCSNVTVTRASRNDCSTHGLFKLSPSIFAKFSRFYGHGNKTSCGRFSEKEEGEDGKTQKTDSINYFQDNFRDALRLSGIFVVGWYLLQPYSHKNVIFSPQQSEEKCTFSILSKFTYGEYLKVLNYLKCNILPLPSILPDVQAKGKEELNKTSQEINGQEDEDTESNLLHLEHAHNIVTGTLSNFQGAQAIEQENYSAALEYFEEGAKLGNPAAIFNLGICHEMGFGTDKNYEKAAAFYKRASDLGHATATYNLGVFYVHGYGNVKPDINKARQLFKSAADLGQENAKLALDLENSKFQVPQGMITGIEKDSTLSNNVAEENCNNDKTILSDCNKTMYQQEGKLSKFQFLCNKFSSVWGLKDQEMLNKKNTISDDDSGALDLSPSKVSVVFV